MGYASRVDLYRRYGPALMRKCERMLGNAHDAEDVVQSLFVDLLRKGRRDVELAYLYRAATSRCLNLLRDAGRRRALLARQGEEVLAPARERLVDRVVSADLLARLAERLDRRSLEILVLHHQDGLSQEEVAALLRVSRRTVGKRLTKARRIVEQLTDADAGSGGGA